MEELRSILQAFDWSPLWISPKTGIVATIICFSWASGWPGRSFGWGQNQSRSRRYPDAAHGGSPTVAGFFLLLLFS